MIVFAGALSAQVPRLVVNVEDSVLNDKPADAACQHLLAENQQLRAELAGVARANVLAAELMAELEEANEHLARTSEELKQEVNKRRQMEQMLQQSRAMLNNILNSSLDAIFVFQAVRDGRGAIGDFEFLVANPAALRLLGAQALVGRRLLETWPQSRLNGLFDACSALVESGQPLRQELSIVSEGAQGWFHVVGVRLGDGLSVTFRNISELRAADVARPAVAS